MRWPSGRPSLGHPRRLIMYQEHESASLQEEARGRHMFWQRRYCCCPAHFLLNVPPPSINMLLLPSRYQKKVVIKVRSNSIVSRIITLRVHQMTQASAGFSSISKAPTGPTDGLPCNSTPSSYEAMTHKEMVSLLQAKDQTISLLDRLESRLLL